MKRQTINQTQPIPLLDTIEHVLLPNYKPPLLLYKTDWQAVIFFLKKYKKQPQTFNAYRRELERLLQWSWLIAQKSILMLKRNDIQEYITFCENPPLTWIGKKGVYRFIEEKKRRIPNPDWRPFVFTKSKNNQQTDYELSPKAIHEIFTVLNSFYNTLLIDEKIEINPVFVIKKQRLAVKKSPEIKLKPHLTQEQWLSCIDTVTELAQENASYHRILFIMYAMAMMKLSLSDFINTNNFYPMMNHFYQQENQWLFKKHRQGKFISNITVTQTMLVALQHYRQSLGLAPLPSINDTSAFLPKIKGSGAMTDAGYFRRLLQQCIQLTADKLRQQKNIKDADQIQKATPNWFKYVNIIEKAEEYTNTINITSPSLLDPTTLSNIDKFLSAESNKDILHHRLYGRKIMDRKRNEKLGKDDDTLKWITLKMYFYIENNSKWVRGKGRSLKEIEDWIFRDYDIKKLSPQSNDYEITLEYTTYKTLDDQLEELINEMHSTADRRNGFLEIDVHTFDGEASWPFEDWKDE